MITALLCQNPYLFALMFLQPFLSFIRQSRDVCASDSGGGGVGGIFLCFDMPDVESSSRKPITMSTTKPRAPPSSPDNKTGKTEEK